ncbi:hypothetical protein PINS_up002537 [Pythium insidiosum]|nr:hypothetical protein PINS_up002537 [Pythium insidiosum]
MEVSASSSSSSSSKKKKKNKKSKKKGKKTDAQGADGAHFDVRNAPARGDSMAHASPDSARESLEVGSSCNGDALVPRDGDDAAFDDGEFDDNNGDVDGEEDDDEDGDDDDFSSESEEEDAASYKTGGYHRVQIGDVYNGRFEVLEKLGWGHFSTVWKCRDRETSEVVAMKVQKSARHYREAAEDEIELLECTVKAAQSHRVAEIPIVRLVDSFQINGPNGLHVCMVFEMLGDNLLTLIKHYNYRGVPMPLVKTLTRDMLEGLAFLHSKCRIIHTDLKPENVLLNRKIPRLPRLRRSLFWKERRAAVGSSPSRCRDARAASGAAAAATMSTATSSQPSGIDGDTSGLSREEKKKLKKKLKKKRQKQQKKQAATNEEDEEDDDGDDEDAGVHKDDDGVSTTTATAATALLTSSMASLSIESSTPVVDAAFAANFVESSTAVIATPQPLSNKRQQTATDDAEVVDDDNWIEIPPEHCARVMVVLGPGHIAGSRRKELEFTIRHDAKREADGWTSFVLRFFDRVDDAYMSAYDAHMHALKQPQSTSSSSVGADPFQIWRLELDVRYATAVFGKPFFS